MLGQGCVADISVIILIVISIYFAICILVVHVKYSKVLNI